MKTQELIQVVGAAIAGNPGAQTFFSEFPVGTRFGPTAELLGSWQRDDLRMGGKGWCRQDADTRLLALAFAAAVVEAERGKVTGRDLIALIQKCDLLDHQILIEDQESLEGIPVTGVVYDTRTATLQADEL